MMGKAGVRALNQPVAFARCTYEKEKWLCKIVYILEILNALSGRYCPLPSVQQMILPYSLLLMLAVTFGLSDGARVFQSCRMPFGLHSAPQTFQRTIHLVLASVLGKHTAAYLNEITFSRGLQQRLERNIRGDPCYWSATNPRQSEIVVCRFKFLGHRGQLLYTILVDLWN